MTAHDEQTLAHLAAEVKELGRSLGFGKIGIAGVDLAADERRLEDWLAAGRHGTMEYMRRHGRKRTRPADLVEGTARVISARMDYWPGAARDARGVLGDPRLGYVARYALGRDYHKVLRPRLERLARAIEERAGAHGYRAFVDSAPVLEKALARNAGLGWIGKHTNLLDRDAGSWFVLGELYTSLPLPVDAPATDHCGSCRACIDVCPTRAIVAPYELDARRCISYLTIEHHSAIPEELRPLIGNRIFGCDDCQLVCPWNKFARAAAHPDFRVRNRLDGTALTELFRWTESEFEERMRGSAIHRLGFVRWSRNLAVALGNAPHSPEIIRALEERRADASAMVREHVEWALGRHGAL